MSRDQTSTEPPPGFHESFLAPFHGAPAMLRDPKQFKYLIVPWGLTILSVLGLLIGGAWMKPEFLTPYQGFAGGESPTTYTAVFGPILYYLLMNVTIVFGGFQLSLIVGAPAYAKLETKIRQRLIEGTTPKEPVVASVRSVIERGIRFLLYGLLQWMILNRIGTDEHADSTAFIVSIAVTFVWIAFTYFDFREDADERYAARLQYFLKSPVEVFGFTFGMFLIYVTPILNLLWASMGIIGCLLLEQRNESKTASE